MRRREYQPSGSYSVDQKDQQVIQLKLALQTQITRNSLIHNRLLAALDSLDLQQLTHHDEIRELVKSRDLLRARLTRYVKVVETKEAEKNDMRDAVLQLVQRVESAKNYAAMPCSHITLATPVDEVHHTNQRPQSSAFLNLSRSKGKDKEQDLGLDIIGYAPSVIASLRQERDNERKAHDQTRSELEARIWALEAMVSRRESELEFLVAQPNGEADDQNNVVPTSINPRHQHMQLEEDVISMLDAIVVRNRKLDSEIRSLAKKLDHARTRAARGRRSRETSSSRPPTNSVSASRPSGIGAVSPPPLLNKTHLKELENELQELDDKITLFAAERRATQQDLGLIHEPQRVEVGVGPDPNLQDDIENDNDERDWNELVAQLEDMTSQRDALLEEIEQLRGELHRTRLQTTEGKEDTILAGTSLFSPQDESPSTRLTNVQPVQSIPSFHDVSAHNPQAIPTGNLLDTDLDEGEESMDLATPLIPLVSLEEGNQTALSPNPFNPIPRPQTRKPPNDSISYNIDPATVELPDSPEEEVESNQAQAEWDFDFAKSVDLDIGRFRSPPVPSPATSGSLPGSPAISPTLTLASIRGIPASSTADLDFSPETGSKSIPLPDLQPSPMAARRDGVQRRKSKSTPRSTSRKSSQRGRDDGRSRTSASASPGMSHMEELLDGFGSDGHSVERETY